MPKSRATPTPISRSAIAAAVVALAVCAVSAAASAQGWSWPWSTPQQPSAPPIPREPVYRPPPPPMPGGQPPLQGQPYGQQPYGQAAPGGRSAICLQLEQRLAQEANRGTSSRDQIPKLDAERRQLDRQVQMLATQLERGDCYEYFLFSKTLRRTRQCVDTNSQLEATKRRLSEVDVQLQQINASGSRSYRDDIVRELARNNCGATYQQEASRSSNPFSTIWQDEDEGTGGGGRFGTNLPFATFRTVCVRLCDGYYFPVSFSTLPNHFDRDSDLCQSRCAAPAELFYYQNPGGAMDGAVSHKSKQTYASLKTAFRYRKEYVQGCSCKQSEYLPSSMPPERRADMPASGHSKPSSN